uniref:Uncharacterized protein n=1 Tax=Oryza glumipatula TaxID=40148 RepID=A0A0E0AJA4_9ORYZ
MSGPSQNPAQYRATLPATLRDAATTPSRSASSSAPYRGPEPSIPRRHRQQLLQVGTPPSQNSARYRARRWAIPHRRRSATPQLLRAAPARTRHTSLRAGVLLRPPRQTPRLDLLEE